MHNILTRHPKVTFYVNKAQRRFQMQNLLHENLLKDAKETENLDNQELLVMVNEPTMFKIFRTHHTIQVVGMEDISHISALGEASKIYLKSGEGILSTKALAYYAKSLEYHPHFFKVHKRTVIHLQQIAEFNYRDNLLIMRNGERVECSRRMGRNLYCFLLNG